MSKRSYRYSGYYIEVAVQEVGVKHFEGTAKSDPVSLDTVWTTMTAAKEAGHARQATEVHDSWQ